MSVISRNRRRISIGMTSTLSAFILALVFTLSSGALTFAAGLVQISSDPFTNKTSNHKTEVEPDTFAFGNTIVSAFQQGRFFDGGGSDIGFPCPLPPSTQHHQTRSMLVPVMPQWPSMPSTMCG